MYRLDNNAFEILCTEVEVCSLNEKQGLQKQQIVLQRLKQLRSKVGKRAKLNELRAVEAIPPETLAHIKAEAKLKVYKRYYEKIAQTK